jgi:hypothetical protein
MATPAKLIYDEATGKYKWNPFGIGPGMTVSSAKAATIDPDMYASNQGKVAEKQWTNTYEPMWNKYGAEMQRGLQTAYDRSLAEARGKLGYGLSMQGSGEGGLAEASRLSLETEAQNKRMDIAAQRDMALQQAHLQFMQTKDAQAFEIAKMGVAYNYNKMIAEMNQPSWWESLGQIAGMGLAMFNPVGAVTGASSGGGITSPYALNGVYA